MPTPSLQQQIDRLRHTASAVLHPAVTDAPFYADDFTRLNREIRTHILTLSQCKGSTPEQEASLCLAVLMGFSVMMYANPEDERLKARALERAAGVLGQLSDAELRSGLRRYSEELGC